MVTLLLLVVVTYIVESSIPKFKLHNAASEDSYIPAVGLGCALSVPDDQKYEVGYSSATQWLKVGGRYFDEAHCYNSRYGVVAGVMNYTKNYTLIPREDLFIVSKIGGCSGNNLGYDGVMNWFDDILNLWNTTYIDVLLVHWPSYDHYYKYAEQLSTDPACQAYVNNTYGAQYNATLCRLNTWKAMIELYVNGKAKAIGVSNFEIQHLNDVINYKYDDGKSYIPAINQMQFHGYWHEYDLLNFCNENHIRYNSWSTLGAPDVTANVWNGTTPVLTQHPVAIKIGEKYGKTAAQVWLRWNIQLEVIPIPRSNNISHMIDNMDIFDFELSEDDMKQLYNLTAPPYWTNLVYTLTPQQDPNNLP